MNKEYAKTMAVFTVFTIVSILIILAPKIYWLQDGGFVFR